MKRFVIAAVAVSFLLAPAAWAGGKDLFDQKCTRCHGASKTVEKKASKDYWEPLVQRMQKKRSNYIPDKDAAQIVAFLSETYATK
jgi:cytochrome c5